MLKCSVREFTYNVHHWNQFRVESFSPAGDRLRDCSNQATFWNIFCWQIDGGRAFLMTYYMITYLLHNVFPSERQEQQVLRAATTGPSSIRLTWRVIQSSQGYRLEWRETEGQICMTTSPLLYNLTEIWLFYVPAPLSGYNKWEKWWNHYSWRMFIQLFNFVEKKKTGFKKH